MSKTIEAEHSTSVIRRTCRHSTGSTSEVEEGTIFALLGPNGAGKSTTVKILTTLTRPDSGEAQRRGPRRPRRSPTASAARSASSGRSTASIPRRPATRTSCSRARSTTSPAPELQCRVAELLERFNLTAAAERPVKTYSGGMQRRLDIAMGLLHRPAALFLDEPTTGLDPEARVDMWEEIERLASEERMTILLTTHYLDEADELAAAARDRRPRAHRREGNARGAEERARGRCDPLRARRAAADGSVREALERVEGLTEITADGRFVRARARNGATAMPPALAALEAAGITVASVTMARPSLDEVYLRHAGRSFREAEAVA